MQLKVQPSNSNLYPLSGFFLAGAQVTAWLEALQTSGLSLGQVVVYPLPGKQANSIWGCYIETQNLAQVKYQGLHTYAQSIEGLLVVPEHSQLFPKLSLAELQGLFKNGKTVYHPEVGFYELGEPVAWEELLAVPEEADVTVQIPEDPAFVPQRILSFRIKPSPEEESLAELEKPQYPDKDGLSDKPLSTLEKARLSLYKALKGGKAVGGSSSGAAEGITTGVGGAFGIFGGLLAGLGGLGQKWMDRMEQDMDDLENRNKKTLDKLMDMIKKDPEEGLKYAIPLDDNGTSRGDGNAPLWLTKLWGNLSFGAMSPGMGGAGGGGAVDLGDDYFKLREQYEQSAKELIALGKYEKAAFVYFQLLKDKVRAAQTLRDGKLYAKAANFYLKHLKDKQTAALCFEEGKMYDEAILLYQEIENYEKAGDLCMKVNRRKQAMHNYTQLANGYLEKRRYVKAALVYKDKMEQPEKGQAYLLQGWKEEADAVNCLQTYFSNIKETTEFKNALQQVYEHEVYTENQVLFLEVLRLQYPNREDAAKQLRDMAYEIVASEAHSDPYVLDKLSHFNASNKEFRKDVMRFRLYQKKK